MIPAAFLDDLVAATRDAEAAETAFRREAAARMAALETARAFAFRRLNWMKEVAQAVTGAEDAPAAVAHARAALRARLGWSGDNEAHEEVLARFGAVASALFVENPAEDGGEERAERQAADVGAALAAFEAWYEAAHGRSFWVLFAHHIPETPLVDF